MIIGFDGSRAFVANRTGTENYSYQILKHVLKQDHKNSYRVYLRDRLAIDDPILQKPNVERVYIGIPRLWTQGGLAYHALLHKPDVLFVPAHTMPVIRWPHLKTVVTIHDLGAEYLPEYHQFPQKLYLNRSTEYAVKHASHVIAVSEATKHDLIKRLNAQPDKITVIPEGFAPTQLPQQSESQRKMIKQKYHLPDAYLLFVGTIQPRKNLVRLIEAFAKLVSSEENQTKDSRLKTLDLVLAGKKGWLAEEIYEAPKKFGVAARVHFIGYVPAQELPGLMEGAKGFVYPSLFEGFGLPILEAFACGVPVLTSSVSSMPEVAGDAAILVDPESVTEIANGMVRLVTDERLRKYLVLQGRQRLPFYTWEKAAQQTITILETVGKGEGI